MSTERNLWQNSTAFEPLSGWYDLIPRKKPTAGNDDGFECKYSRGNKTAIELFLAGIACWEAGLRRMDDWRMDDGKPKPD